MKLKFKNQAFQMDAVNAVVDLFAGQEKTRSTFSVMEEAQTNFLNELGQGNALYIDQETLTANMHTVQKRNNLPLTPHSGRLASSVLRWKLAPARPTSTPRPSLS